MNRENFLDWFTQVTETPEEKKRKATEAYLDGRIDGDTYLMRMREIDRKAD